MREQIHLFHPSAFILPSGALGKPGSSRLIFNQEMRGFESHTPCQLFGANAERDYIFGMARHARLLVARPMWVVAQHAEHRTVTAAVRVQVPSTHPNFSHGTVAEGLGT